MFKYWTLVQLFLINLVFFTTTFLISKMFLNLKFKDISLKRLLFIIPLFIISYLGLIYLDFDNNLSLIYFIVIFLLIKLVFHKSFNDTIFIYLCIGLIYFIFTYFINVFIFLSGDSLIINFKDNHYEIVIVSILSLILALFIRKLVNRLHYKVKNKIDLKIIIVVLLDLIAFLFSIYYLKANNLEIHDMFFSFIIPIFILGISFILVYQIFKKYEFFKKYNLLEEYIETSSYLIEKYSSTIHKYKNNLITIKGYLRSDSNLAIEYVDDLLGDYKKKKYNWVMNLNRIREDSIRYFVYYKLSKAEDLKLKITVEVSNEVKKIDYSDFKVNEIGFLTEVLGEYFDNAIYASLESSSKELHFMVYLEDGNLVFLISNTYKGKVDLKKIEEHGYTTKGAGHGLGLYEIHKGMKNRSKFDYSYELLDNYFIAKLLVKASKQEKN